MFKRLYFLALLLLMPFVSMAADYSVAPMNVGDWFVKLGDVTATMPVKVTNYGSQKVSRISYTLYNVTTQKSQDEREITLTTPIDNGETATIQVPLGPSTTFGQEELIFTVTKVNGNYNSASVNYTYVERYTVKKVAHKRVLVEDYTGTWCQYCPAGIIAMESLSRLYPDDFVGVSIHCADKLSSTSAYQDGMESKWAPNKPSVWMNRKDKLAGYDGRSMFEIASKVVTPFELGVKARWNAAKTNIEVEATVEACMTQSSNVTYAVAYVLTASGLKGYSQMVNPSYKTENNDPVFDPEFAPFKNLDNYYKTYYNTALTFNDVAIASQGISTGVSETAFSQLAVGSPCYYQTTFDNISQYSVVSDPTKLAVIAMLINQKTGQVENVAKCSVSEPVSSFTLNFDKSPWITLYSDRAYTLPSGIATYTVDEDGQLVQFSPGTRRFNVAGHTALLLKSEQGRSFTINYTAYGSAPTTNCLYGSSEDEQTYAPQELTDNDVYYYKLANDTKKGLGFFWGATDGGAFTSKAGRCYLVLKRNKLSANRRQGFPLDDITTGISSTISPTPSSPKTIFDLTGKPIKAPQGAGVYIIDGKKVVRTK